MAAACGLTNSAKKLKRKYPDLPGKVSGDPSGLRLAKQVDDHFERGILKRLAQASQRLIESNGSILHPLVRFLRSADQEKMVGAGDTMFSVALIETDAEKANNLALFATLFGGHRVNPLEAKAFTAL
jgi:hypothetical protein